MEYTILKTPDQSLREDNIWATYERERRNDQTTVEPATFKGVSSHE